MTRPLAASQTGRTPISASAWAMSSPPVRMLAVPQADSAMPRRVGAVLLGMALDEQPRRMPAELPGRRGRHGAGVDANRNCARSAAPPAGRGSARRTGRARRSGRRARRAAPAISAAPQAATAGRRVALDPAEDGAGLRASPAPALAVARDQPQRQRLQPLDRVAGGAPALTLPSPACGRGSSCGPQAGPSPASGGGFAVRRLSRRARRPRPGPRLGQIAASAGRRRARDRRRARAAATRRSGAAAARQRGRARPADRSSRSPSGRAAEDVQPVADLQLLQLAEKAVELAAARRRSSSPAAMPQSRSSPARADALEDLRRRAASTPARIAARRRRNIRRSGARARPARHSCRRGSAAASDGR